MEKSEKLGKFDFIEVDRRIVEQKLRKHQLSQQDYQKLLKGLDDDQAFGEELIVYKEESYSDS